MLRSEFRAVLSFIDRDFVDAVFHKNRGKDNGLTFKAFVKSILGLIEPSSSDETEITTLTRFIDEYDRIRMSKQKVFDEQSFSVESE
jgi:hypothetical protein